MLSGFEDFRRQTQRRKEARVRREGKEERKERGKERRDRFALGELECAFLSWPWRPRKKRKLHQVYPGKPDEQYINSKLSHHQELTWDSYRIH